MILTVHLSDAALTAAPQIDPATGTLGLNLARLDNHRQLLTADAVREWCGTPGTQVIVKPVIDLHDTVAVDSYEVPDRIATRVKLARTTCTFPHCRRPADTADLDHTTEYVPPDQGGPPGQTSTDNLAPLCRHDHRAKTHPSPTGNPGPSEDSAQATGSGPAPTATTSSSTPTAPQTSERQTLKRPRSQPDHHPVAGLPARPHPLMLRGSY